MDLRVHLSQGTAATARAHALLAEMPAERRDDLARLAQERASELGLMRGERAIPLVLSPVALPREELATLGRAAHLVVSALVKVCRELIERFPERARLLFDHLSPLEQEALRTRWREAEELLIARVDWFGNVQLAAMGEDLAISTLTGRVVVNDVEATVGEKFADVPAGGLLVYVNSAGHVAIACNDGNAHDVLGRPDAITIADDERKGAR